MLTPLNAVQQAFWDTLVHKADGEPFDALTRFYGFPRYRSWDLTAWRKALHSVAFGPRGISQNVFTMLRGIFSNGEVTNFGLISSSNALLQKDTGDGESKFGTSTWNDAIIGRWIEIKARTSKAAQYVDLSPDEVPEGIYQVVGKASSTTLNLCPVKSSYWKKAPDFTTLAASHNVHVVVLPFKVRDRVPGPLGPANSEDIPKNYGVVSGDGELTPLGAPCITEILLYQNDIPELVPPPGTYMQDDSADAGDFTAAGARYEVGNTGVFEAAPQTPLGGHIQLNAFETGSQIVGPFPIYFASEDGSSQPFGLADILNDILPSGCRFKFVNAVEGEV